MSDAELSDDAAEWRWADADGAQKVVDEWELVDVLSSGQLPPYTLVWRTGWAEWLPANKVSDLSTALPAGKAEPPATPKLEAGRKEPPPPPLEHYKSLQTREAAAKLVGGSTAPGIGAKQPPRQRAHTPPPPPGSEGGARESAAAAALIGKAGVFATPPPPPPPQPQRPPMPTLVDMPRQAATVTLRPPGAVPPPPRGTPSAGRMRIADDVMDLGGRPATATPIPEPIESKQPPKAARKKQKDRGEREAPSDAAAAEQPTLRIATETPLAPGGALPSWSDDVDAELAQLENLPEGGERAARPDLRPSIPSLPPRAYRRPQQPPIALIALGGLAAVLTIVVVILLITRSRAPSTATVGIPETADPGAQGETTASTGPCTLATQARKVMASIYLGVQPSVTAVPGGSRVAIGFAATRSQAQGITVDPKTLDSATVFRQSGAVPVTGVVPLIAEGALRFEVDREGGDLREARTVDAKPPFVVGLTNDGIVVKTGSAAPRVVWPGEASAPITEIRVASVADSGHAVTFRRGGQSGRVLSGWLGPHGAKKTALESVQTPMAYMGTPIIAANDRDTLVAFANRGSPDEYWGLSLATAPHGSVPRKARRFSTPPGGRGAGAISPAATGLHNGRWLLQWTEGGSGEHQVRIQTLDADLVPIGDPIDVSPVGANAGQGVVWVKGEHAFSLFLVTKGNNNELWGAVLRCP